MLPLKEIIDGIHGQVAKNEDDLKVHVSEYNNICSQLNAINRKQIGSLAVCDLSNLVKLEDIITSENLTTLLAIVPKYSQKDWLFGYETLTNYVDEDGEKHFEAKLQQIEARFYVAFGCQYGPVRPVLAHHKLASPTRPAKQNGLPFLARPFSS
ncbi:hypothetical protein JHK85_009996 [Glycine max]|nr:hypothetical protein JHK85_009996 [Glycine max]